MRRLLPPPAADVSALELADLYDDVPARHVRAGMVLSADGGVAYAGTSLPLSSVADRAVFRTLRAVADVVLVGAGTARAEDYGPVPLPAPLLAWRREHGRGGAAPPLAVVSRRLDLDPGLRLFAGGSRPLVLTCAAAPPAGREALAGRADVLVVGDDDVDPAAAVDALAGRGLTRVLCEGGPRLLGDVVRAGLLDELCMTLAPALVGAAPGMVATALPAPLPLRLVHVLEQDGSLLLRWAVVPGREASGQ